MTTSKPLKKVLAAGMLSLGATGALVASLSALSYARALRRYSQR